MSERLVAPPLLPLTTAHLCHRTQLRTAVALLPCAFLYSSSLAGCLALARESVTGC